MKLNTYILVTIIFGVALTLFATPAQAARRTTFPTSVGDGNVPVLSPP